MTDRELIERLGGPTEVTRRLNYAVTRSRVSMWAARNAIPARWWVVMEDMARRDGLDWRAPTPLIASA